jgi:hypothetical protein
MQQAGQYEHANLISECCAVHGNAEVGIGIGNGTGTGNGTGNGVGTEMGSNTSLTRTDTD